MINALTFLLQQTTNPAGQQSAPPPGGLEIITSPLTLMVILLAVFWFVTMRSKRKQEQQRQDMLNQLKRGDRVQTIGGIMGTVIEARDDEVLVKVDESSNTKIRFARSAIHRVVAEEKASAK